MALLSRNINTIGRCGAQYRARYSSENLPGIYHSYVFAVCNNPGWSQDRLAKHLCISKSNVTRHMTYLEENGYIRREVSDKDKREMLIYPTQKMKDILPEAARITREWNAAITEGISEEEMRQFMRVLEKMANKASEIIHGTEQTNEDGR